MGKVRRMMARALGEGLASAAQWIGVGRGVLGDVAPHPRFRTHRPTQIVERAAFASGGIAYGGRGDTLYRSNDLFQTMFPVDRLPGGRTCYLVFVDSHDRVYWNAIDAGQLRRSTDGGATWATVLRLRGGLGHGFWGMCEQPTTGYLFAGEYTTSLAASCRVYRSTDDGATWSQVLYVPGEHHVHAVHSAEDGTLYAATGDSLSVLYRSDDNGDSWGIVHAGRNLTAIASAGATLLLGSDGGWSSDIWQSRDRGVTWQSCYHQSPRRDIVWIRHFGQGVLLASQALDADTPLDVPAELLLSEDYGASWAVVYRWDEAGDWAGSWRESNVFQGWLHLSDERGLNLLVTPVAAPLPTVVTSPSGAVLPSRNAACTHGIPVLESAGNPAQAD